MTHFIFRSIPKPRYKVSRNLPQVRVRSIIYDRSVYALTHETLEDSELRLVLPVDLRLFKRFWIEMLFKSCWRLLLGVIWVLPPSAGQEK